MQRTIAKSPLFILTCFFASSIFGATNLSNHKSLQCWALDNSPFQFNPWPIRATGWALGGTRNVDIGDAMWPVYGNDNGMFFINGQGKYATDNNWVGSIGGGVRQIYRDARIFGAYIFYDHNIFKSQNAATAHFDVISPVSNRWEILGIFV